MNNIFSQEITFSHITVNDGLSTNFVNCMCQDRKGFLWIGTENGLQRYDGNKFLNISSRNENARLPSLPVDQLLYDTLRDVIWVRMGIIIGELNTVNGDYKQAINPHELLPNGNIPIELYIDSRNHVILTEAGVGVFVYNEKANAFETNPLVIQLPEKFSITSIYEDKNRGWFYLCGKQGLRIYNPLKQEFYSADNNPYHLHQLEATKLLDYVGFVFIDSKKRFWIKTWRPAQALHMYVLSDESSQLEEKKFTENIYHNYFDVYSLKENNGFVWAYGENIFNFYDNDTTFHKGYINNINTGINFSIIKQVFEDRDKNFWVISDNGLYQAIVTNNYVRRGWFTFLNGASMTAVHNISNNLILGSSWGHGISTIKYDNSNLEISEDSLIRKTVFKGVPLMNNDFYGEWCFLYDSLKHLLIIGCQAGHIIRYNTITKKSRFLTPPAFGNSTVRQIVKDADGNYWYGTHSGKIIKQEDDKYILVQDYDNAFISKLMVDSKGLLWAGTSGFGIQVIDTHTNKVVDAYNRVNKSTDAVSSNYIHDILQLNDSIYVICPLRNLDVLNIKTKKFIHYNTTNGLPDNTIYTIIKDAAGRIWMTTNDGIAKFDWRNNSFHAYTKKDGLITVVNNDDLLYTGTLLNNHDVMFAGEKSNYIIFNPDSITDKKIPKDVTITDISLFNNFLPVDSVLRNGFHLHHNENTITIYFNSLMYAGTTKLVYYFRLLGSSKQWIRADNPYKASYASLSPGSYTFQVKCENADGISCAHITSLDIDILKPYWQTWWFIALIIIAALIPVYIIYYLRIKRLEAVQKIREKVARDLHDDVGSTLTSINILSEFSKTKVDEKSEVKDYLNRISNTSSQMMDAMDDIVWNIKPSNDTMEKIEARMREYAAAVFEPKEITYRFINNYKIKNISLNMDVRRSLFLIFKETLNNIAKYANANLVTVQFELKNAQLLLMIIDDGVGFDEARVVYGNGIENMQKRAKSFKGSYNIKSYPGKGTHVLLMIPLSKYYT